MGQRPDLTQLPPRLFFGIVVALIAAMTVMEVAGNEDTILVIAGLLGLIGLQNQRTSQVTDRIEKQTNGVLSRHMNAVRDSIDGISASVEQMTDRLARGDREFSDIRARQNTMLAKQREHVDKVDTLIVQVSTMQRCAVCGMITGSATDGETQEEKGHGDRAGHDTEGWSGDL